MSAWVDQIFESSEQVRRGGLVRRKARDVHRLDALDEIVRRARHRGWHVLEMGGQVVVLCDDPGNVRVHC